MRVSLMMEIKDSDSCLCSDCSEHSNRSTKSTGKKEEWQNWPKQICFTFGEKRFSKIAIWFEVKTPSYVLFITVAYIGLSIIFLQLIHAGKEMNE